jgi:hypothetical protein
MVDNVAITAGAGTTVAADDISSVYYQRVKLALGADGVANDAEAGAGAVDTGTMRVTLASDDPAVALLTTMDTDTGNIVTAVQLIDDTVYVDDADWTGDTSKHMLGGAVHMATYQAVTDGDTGPLVSDANGKLLVDGGKAFQVSVAPTVTAGAYGANDVLGAKMTLTAAARVSGGSGVLTGISMFDEGPNGVVDTIGVFIFNADPSGSTFTDNAALAIVDADGPKIIASALLDEIYDTGDGQFICAKNLNIPYVCSGSANLFAVAVQRGTWAPDATDGITFTFHMIRD